MEWRWYDFAQWICLIALWVVILIRLRHNLAVRKYWVLFFAVYALTEILGTLFSLQKKSNLWLYNLSYPIQFILVLLYMLRTLKLTSKIFFTWLITGLVACVIFAVSVEFDKFNSLEIIMFNSIIIIVGLLYFKKVLETEEPIDFSTSEFWFCSSLFIYFGISLWHNGFLGFIIENNLSVARELFDYIIINSYVFYGLTMYALLTAKKT